MGFEDDPRDESYWDDHPDNPANTPPTKSTEEFQAEHIAALEAENAKLKEQLSNSVDLDAYTRMASDATKHEHDAGELRKALELVLSCPICHDKNGHAYLHVPARSLSDPAALAREALAKIDGVMNNDTEGIDARHTGN